MFYFYSVFFAIAYKYILANKSMPIEYAIISLAIFVFLFLLDFYHQQKRKKMVSIREWDGATLLVVLTSLALTGISKDTTFIMPVIFAIMFSYRSPSTFMKSFFLNSITCFLIHFFFYFSGYLASNNLTRVTSEGDIAIRYSLGFVHPNVAIMFFLPIFFSLYFYSDKTRYQSLVKFLFLVIGCCLFLATKSRTGFMVLLMFYFFNLGVIRKRISRLLSYRVFCGVLKYSFFILLFTSIVFAFIGTDPNSIINKLFSGRPYLFHLYLSNGLKLFRIQGYSNIDSRLVPSQFDATLDNVYIFLLTQYGIIPTLIIGLLFVKLFKQLFNNKSFTLIITIFTFLLYGLMETNTIVPSLNFTLPFLIITYFNGNYFSKYEVI